MSVYNLVKSDDDIVETLWFAKISLLHKNPNIGHIISTMGAWNVLRSVTFYRMVLCLCRNLQELKSCLFIEN